MEKRGRRTRNQREREREREREDEEAADPTPRRYRFFGTLAPDARGVHRAPTPMWEGNDGSEVARLSKGAKGEKEKGRWRSHHFLASSQ